MKGIKDVYLHPDNLMAGKKYRVTFKGLHDPSVSFIKEGKFVRVNLFWTNNKDCPKGTKNYLQATFLFVGGTYSLAWDRVICVQEISISKRSSDDPTRDKKPRKPKAEDE